MARLNRPAIMVYGGTIRGGKHPVSGEPLNIVDALESYGAYVYDKISEDERQVILKHACPGPGACGGMYTVRSFLACCNTDDNSFVAGFDLLLTNPFPFTGQYHGDGH